jgi:hypothetical protein
MMEVVSSVTTSFASMHVTSTIAPGAVAHLPSLIHVPLILMTQSFVEVLYTNPIAALVRPGSVQSKSDTLLNAPNGRKISCATFPSVHSAVSPFPLLLVAAVKSVVRCLIFAVALPVPPGNILAVLPSTFPDRKQLMHSAWLA